jgi:hypothetical protein
MEVIISDDWGYLKNIPNYKYTDHIVNFCAFNSVVNSVNNYVNGYITTETTETATVNLNLDITVYNENEEVLEVVNVTSVFTLKNEKVKLFDLDFQRVELYLNLDNKTFSYKQ